MSEENDSIEDARLVIAIVHDNDADILESSLEAAHFRVTRLKSSGGFLKEGNTTFLIGTAARYLDELMEIIEENCRERKRTISPLSPIAAEMQSYHTLPMEVEVGGATVFVIEVEQFKKL